MTIKELEKQCFINKKVVVEEKEKKIKEWFKALYKDCEDNIKEDRETGPYAFPSDYTAFDLFVDNIILCHTDSSFYSCLRIRMVIQYSQAVMAVQLLWRVVCRLFLCFFNLCKVLLNSFVHSSFLLKVCHNIFLT